MTQVIPKYDTNDAWRYHYNTRVYMSQKIYSKKNRRCILGEIWLSFYVLYLDWANNGYTLRINIYKSININSSPQYHNV